MNATDTNNGTLFHLRSRELMTSTSHPEYNATGVVIRGVLREFKQRVRMPAYIHLHDFDMAPVTCPGCTGRSAMFVREVEPHWSLAKIDFIYECSDCGAEVTHTVTRPQLPH